MKPIVLDSSAVLAMIFQESGGERVMELLLSAESSIAMSVVNWCEILTVLQRKASNITAEKMTALLPGVEIVPFTINEAEQTASLTNLNRSLSLGDRACLSLTIAREAQVWTTDRAWAQITVGADLRMLRNAV